MDGPRKSYAGGAGLTSTARDYARFLETIRNGGIIDGVRIMAPRTARLMTTNQSGTLHSASGLGFGYGFQTVDRYGASGMAGAGGVRLGRRLRHHLPGRYGGPHGRRPDAAIDAERD